ncbi:hypothetical protein C2S51_002808 [Perilla frutescens var. frutescens]|nr:hypothetical protein C2S51_002808 [Perilla frutescens var. frutescens]
MDPRPGADLGTESSGIRTICSQPSHNPQRLWPSPGRRTCPPSVSLLYASLRINGGRPISSEQYERHEDRMSSCRSVNPTPRRTHSHRTAAGNDECETMPPAPHVHDPARAPRTSSVRA